MRWAALAVGCGLAVAGFATSVLSALLYGVSAVDPIAFGAVAFLMGATAYFAAWWPARRAARIDPMVALRSE
jgi:ABC-type antimicrobial peptide transport system permease subunit